MDGRLARCSRREAQEGVQNEAGRGPLRFENAGRGGPRKKTTGPERARPVLSGWKEAQGATRNHARLVAQELIEQAGSRTLEQLTIDDTSKLINRWRAAHALSTAGTKRRELGRLVRHLVSRGASPELLTSLPRVPPAPERTVIATQDEITRLMASAEPWMRCWLAIVAGMGLRRSEALRLAPGHYDPDGRAISYPTKNAQTNCLPATDELRAFFELHPATDKNRWTPLVEIIAGRRITADSQWWAWEKLKKKAGVNPQLRTHDLRRTLAVRVLDRTSDLRIVQRTLGHRSLISTFKYLAHRADTDVRPLLNEIAAARPTKPAWKN